MTITADDPLEAVREWFARLSDCCARVDYAGARAIFAPDVASFGTKADIVSGLDLLQKNQWEGIWPNIANFRVDLSSVRGGGRDGLAWGIAVWSSTGFHEDGKAYERPGRATVVLERRPEVLHSETTGTGRPALAWLAVHTHFSLNPGAPPRTFGRRV
jgi:ketosteroid isomerase-like protein